MGGRKYSTTLSSASSALRSAHQLNLDDECRIEVYGSMRHRKLPNGSEVAYLKVSVTLFHDLIDDQHDLLYLVRQPDSLRSNKNSVSNTVQLGSKRRLNEPARPLPHHGSFTFQPSEKQYSSVDQENNAGFANANASYQLPYGSIIRNKGNQTDSASVSQYRNRSVGGNISISQTSLFNASRDSKCSRLPRSYHELNKKYIVRVKVSKAGSVAHSSQHSQHSN